MVPIASIDIERKRWKNRRPSFLGAKSKSRLQEVWESRDGDGRRHGSYIIPCLSFSACRAFEKCCWCPCQL